MRVLDDTKLIGIQEPRVFNIPPGVDTTEAEDTIALAAEAGLRLLPWESTALTLSMRRRPEDQLLSAQTVGLCVSRRNGKTAIGEARALGGAILLKLPDIVYTAHRDETALDAMTDMLRLLQSSRAFERKIRKVTTQNGHHAIHFTTGSVMRFKTRTADSGRGMDGNLLFLDEAFKIYEAVVASLVPTMGAVHDPQSWYMSSAVDKLKHPHAEAFTRLRRRALKAMETGVPDPDLLYLEYSAETGPDPENPLKDMPLPVEHIDNLRQANPSLGDLITMRFVAAEKKEMGYREWLTERLSIGFWPKEPLPVAVEPEAIPDVDMRRHIATEVAMPAEAPVALAVSMSPTRKWLCIASATQLANNAIHVEIGRREAPTRALTMYLIKLAFRWNVSAIVIDRQDQAMSIVPELTKAGLEIEHTSASQFAAAFGGFEDDVMNAGTETLSFSADPALFDGVAATKKRIVGGGWAPERDDASVPFIAAALARYGLLAFAEIEVAPSSPVIISSQNRITTSTSALDSAFGTQSQGGVVLPVYAGQRADNVNISKMAF